MKVRTHKAYDEAWGKDTIIVENSYGFLILGQDEFLHEIDNCTAWAYILKYMDRRE